MAISRRGIHFIFAAIVTGLGLTAVLSMYMGSSAPAIRTDASTVASSEAMPEEHPPADIADKLAGLIELSMENPQNADIRKEIGNLYYDLGEYDKAVDYYRRSLNIQPGDPHVETDLATCLYYLGRYDEALEILDAVIKKRPDFPQALYNKGIVLIHGNNDIQGGIAVWEHLMETDLEPAKRAELEQSIRQLKSIVR